jgi:polar amino acid transport system substrate-binding protein
MKHVLAVFCGFLLLAVSGAFVGAATTEEVTALVEQTKEAIAANAFQTLAKINKGEHPYKNLDDPALYVFVLDTDLNLVAHFKTDIVGRNQKGKPDSKGKMFRDEILAKALKDGSGWVDYHFENPKTKMIAHKNTFFKLAKGSNGEDYIVCSGKYYDD